MAKEQKRRIELMADIDKAGTTVKIELPFVAGYMSDLGRPKDGLKPVAERAFVEVTKDGATGYNQLFKAISPYLEIETENEIPNERGELDKSAKAKFNLTFESLEDFSPDHIAKSIPSLDALLEERKAYLDWLDQIEGKKIEGDIDQRLAALRKPT